MSNAMRVFKTLAIAGLLATSTGAALVAVAGARGGIGDPGAARPAVLQRSGAPGVTRAYTTPTMLPTSAASSTATVTDVTPPATDTPTDVATPTPSETPPPTDTPTDTPSPTPSATPPPTDTPTPTATRPPRPVYLPLAVRDPICIPYARYSDIVFVVDVSNYMREVINGKASPDWARDWMRATIAHLDMTHAKIGVVQFHRDLWVQELTNNPQDVINAIETDPPYKSGTTRMDLALLQARNMLRSDYATPGNDKVIFFISIMQAKSIPWEGTPGCVNRRGEECAVVFAANEVKKGSIPITIYALALSWYGGGEDLKAVASDPSKAYLLPGDAEMAKIFSEVQVVKLCPALWPRAKP